MVRSKPFTVYFSGPNAGCPNRCLALIPVVALTSGPTHTIPTHSSEQVQAFRLPTEGVTVLEASVWRFLLLQLHAATQLLGAALS
jgi:hypothetical protein